MRWFDEANYDFLKHRKIAYALSGTLVILSLVIILVKGLQFNIDFTGGKEFILEFEKPPEVTEVRDALSDVFEVPPMVKRFGAPVDIVVRTAASGELGSVQQKILSAVQQVYPNNDAKIIESSIIGARFAEDLQDAAVNAVIFALIIIGIYIFIRFRRWPYALSAILALAHDIIIVLGIFTLIDGIVPFNVQIGQTLIAAFLTILGYSINDTVIVYDRVRERLKTHKTGSFLDVVNTGMNETLSRTVITSCTTLFTVVVLFFFGGQTLKSFSLALILGIIIGTYSSIFMATALTVDMELKLKEK